MDDGIPSIAFWFRDHSDHSALLQPTRQTIIHFTTYKTQTREPNITKLGILVDKRMMNTMPQRSNVYPHPFQSYKGGGITF